MPCNSIRRSRFGHSSVSSRGWPSSTLSSLCKNSKLDGKTFADIDYTKYDIIVLGIQDKQISKKFIFNINLYNHKIDVGDVLVVIGNKENTNRFKIECAENNNG